MFLTLNLCQLNVGQRLKTSTEQYLMFCQTVAEKSYFLKTGGSVRCEFILNGAHVLRHEVHSQQTQSSASTH